jgi:2-polyprenyl-3-methyl-5-hydroxy-6-metoxy-1,4-benzoquinol methylase
MTIKNCRFCNSNLNKIFADLGTSPLANSFLKKEQISNEKSFPLCAYVCENCLLVQLEEIESPENIFSEYAYFSSYSDSWLKHAENYVETIISRFPINKNSLVIEIASNDGYLLQYFQRKKIPILGIEPAENVAKKAIEKNIPTITKFFNPKIANQLLQNKKLADLVVGNNVLAHVPNLNDFIKGLKIILKHKGIITLEFPHLLQLIKFNQFDTIYHEHFSYFSLISLEKIFLFHKLQIFDVEEITTHGGSLRIFVTHLENKSNGITKNVNKILNKEKEFGLDNISKYLEFSKNIEIIKNQLNNFFKNIKKTSEKVVCYGAAAKGNTLLNYCEIKNNMIEYVVDRSEYKQKLYLPGSHIPIKSPEEIIKTKPDYVLILPWNLKNEIMNQMKIIREWNGKFVIPIPEVKVY